LSFLQINRLAVQTGKEMLNKQCIDCPFWLTDNNRDEIKLESDLNVVDDCSRQLLGETLIL